ncbi:hypothetical protein IAU60_006363 [Kwoniella sp. DSM 27419]
MDGPGPSREASSQRPQDDAMDLTMAMDVDGDAAGDLGSDQGAAGYRALALAGAYTQTQTQTMSSSPSSSSIPPLAHPFTHTTVPRRGNGRRTTSALPIPTHHKHFIANLHAESIIAAGPSAFSTEDNQPRPASDADPGRSLSPRTHPSSLPSPPRQGHSPTNPSLLSLSRPSVQLDDAGYHHRPDPLDLRPTTSPSSSLLTPSSTSCIRSARRLNPSPYLVPHTARPGYTSSSSTMASVKDVPRTTVPPHASSSTLTVEHQLLALEPPRTPSGSRKTPDAGLRSSPGSMSMAQRPGVRPSFPRARVPSARAGPSSSTRGLPTPQYSATHKRQPVYTPASPLPTAPLTPTPNMRYHQSAPAVPLVSPSPLPPGQPQASTPTPTAAGKRQPNPYQVSLDEIPKDFVLKKLVQLASKYWYAPHSADVHVIVPLKRKANPGAPSTPRTAVPPAVQRQRQARQVAEETQDLPSTQTSATWDRSLPPAIKVEPGSEGEGKPNVLTGSTTTIAHGTRDASGRRGSLPGDSQLEQCLVFPLHRDYLTTQSALFRTLLNCSAAQLPEPVPRDDSGRLVFQSPIVRGAKVLPTKAERPKALYVPLPDPASFAVILHWLYWHDADHFNHCLSKGMVTWQGVIRNIEYLSLDNEIKLLAGRWWKRWVKPTEPTERRIPSGPGLVGGKRRSASYSGKRPAVDDEDEDEQERRGSSGDEADDEDIDLEVIKAATEDGFADHVSARLGRL